MYSVCVPHSSNTACSANCFNRKSILSQLYVLCHIYLRAIHAPSAAYGKVASQSLKQHIITAQSYNTVLISIKQHWYLVHYNVMTFHKYYVC